MRGSGIDAVAYEWYLTEKQ